MKPSYYVITSKEVLAEIYESDEFGRMLIMRVDSIPIDEEIRVVELGNSGSIIENRKIDFSKYIIELLLQKI